MTQVMERVQALERYGILDSEPDPEFAGLVRWLAEWGDSPVAYIAFLDDQRQWFKAQVGLPLSELPLVSSICLHVLQLGQPLAVEDLKKDPRFAQHPLVVGPPRLRQYAGAPVRAEDGIPVGTVCVADTKPRSFSNRNLQVLAQVAGRVERELELRRVQQRLQSQTDSLRLAEQVARIGHWQVPVAGSNVFWSHETFRIFGRPLDKGYPSLDEAVAYYHPEDQNRVRDLIGKAVERGEAFNFQMRILREDGDKGMVQVRGMVRNDGGSRAVFGVVMDITESVQTRSRLLHAERMASVGTLAAGIAHEINNPLSYLLSNAELLQESLPLEPVQPEVLEMVGEVQDGAERIRRIVKGLKDFARPMQPEVRALPLQRVVEVATRLCGNEVNHKARLVWDVAEPTPWVRGDEGQLVQVVINLLLNAAQSIEGTNAFDQRIQVKIREEATEAGPWAVLEVGDSGSGMTEEVLRQAFDPFFSTKAADGGTGLGLSLSHSIVADHRGFMEADSAPGEGTRMRVWLPAIESPEPLASASLPQPTQTSPTRRILVVDDEPRVAKALERQLRPHLVSSITEPSEALRMVCEGFDADVILCDLMMPTMLGSEFYRELSRCCPGQERKVVFMSGGAFGRSVRTFLDQVRPRLFDKPIDLAAFRRFLDGL